MPKYIIILGYEDYDLNTPNSKFETNHYLFNHGPIQIVEAASAEGALEQWDQDRGLSEMLVENLINSHSIDETFDNVQFIVREIKDCDLDIKRWQKATLKAAKKEAKEIDIAEGQRLVAEVETAERATYQKLHAKYGNK